MSELRKTSAAEGPQAVIYDLSRARQRAASATEPTTAPDSAGFTDSARELHRAQAAVEGAPETRTGRVRALKQEIANGTYQPDPEEIARKILDRGF
ncbi:MAG: flagellar biosynthesis anti-sigma factor FlgM [Tepidiformaceae bacterium]